MIPVKFWCFKTREPLDLTNYFFPNMKMILKMVLFTFFLLLSALGSAEELTEKKHSGNTPAAEKPKAAWKRASDHAKNNKSVGIAIDGRSIDTTAQQIGEYLKARLEDKGINSRYYISHPDKQGAVVGFHVKDESYGPTGVSGIHKNLGLVIRDFDEIWQEKDNEDVATPIIVEPCLDMAACTRKEAYDASKGRIMFHYGEGIWGVRELAAALTEHGFTAVALPGYSKKGAGQMRTGKSKSIDFTQDDINFGRIGGLATDLYDTRVGKKKPAPVIPKK